MQLQKTPNRLLFFLLITSAVIHLAVLILFDAPTPTQPVIWPAIRVQTDSPPSISLHSTPSSASHFLPDRMPVNTLDTGITVYQNSIPDITLPEPPLVYWTPSPPLPVADTKAHQQQIVTPAPVPVETPENIEDIAQSANTRSPDPATYDNIQKIDSYMQQIMDRIERHKHYPHRARLRRIQGTATVHFMLDSTGELSTIRIVQISGSSLLDQAALEAVKTAAPFPAIPDSSITSLELELDIAFRMR